RKAAKRREEREERRVEAEVDADDQRADGVKEQSAGDQWIEDEGAIFREEIRRQRHDDGEGADGVLDARAAARQRQEREGDERDEGAEGGGQAPERKRDQDRAEDGAEGVQEANRSNERSEAEDGQPRLPVHAVGDEAAGDTHHA